MKLLTELKDEEALEVSRLLGGAGHLSQVGQIAEVIDLLTTNRLYNGLTNIPGIRWYRAFKYLESKDYIIDIK